MTVAIAIPTEPTGFDRHIVEQLMRTKHPDVAVEGVTLVDAALKSDTDQHVSSARRVGVQVDYGPGGNTALPSRLIIKTGRPEFGDLPLYANEVNVYTRLGDRLPVNTPGCFGGYHDAVNGTFAVILEDLRVEDVRFESVESATTVEDIESLLDQLAALHAAHWQSPRFAGDLSWVLPHTSGPIYELFSTALPALIEYEVSSQQYKREFVEFVAETPETLRSKVAAVQHHQSALPQTLLHGDCHLGNTYRNADGTRGLLDWQLAARGYCMHDVAYLIITGLSVTDRRAHERHLIDYYGDQLRRAGVSDVPPRSVLLDEYRMAAAWCLYVGWLSTPLDNYGWQISIANHIRLATAYHDLETRHAIERL